jgi:hypothetical protein
MYTPIGYRTVVNAIDTISQLGDHIEVPEIDYKFSSSWFDGI